MATELNDAAVRHARALIGESRIARDEVGDWSEHAPTPDEENGYIERHGWKAYALWHLGIDRDENPETKGAYSFPYGDFQRVRRSGLIAAESRAGQFDHTEIEEAARALLDDIDQ